MKEQEKDNNVIEFPADKVQQKRTQEAPSTSSPVSFEIEKKRLLLSGSIVSLLFIASIINTSLLNGPANSTDRSAGRSIASVDGSAHFQRDEDYERKLARQLSQHSARAPASLGTPPSAVDKLRFGFLEGKYAVRFANGKVREIEFTDSANASDEPRYLTDRAKFLSEYKGLLSVPFATAKSQTREIENKKVHETYKLFGDGLRPVGVAIFEMDIYGRLLSMKVESTN